ncbi:uncharacterized protein K441DRAFT_681887 [Cenococcum geophilum 1.58]|uniref:Uncharacterized protein n=1 Tax=Cenococcum geophilum 1.58 TaxID=794803 RepID=A0ACC8EPV8_9PEZI|nr:hypothetical protein K441DRAFT_681887 [Cenococcum geophilum 1.58]
MSRYWTPLLLHLAQWPGSWERREIAMGSSHLWRTLRYRFVSLKTINDAFGIGGNILSFLNWELWREIQIGAVLALVLWCIPLSTLFTPATLSVGHAEKLEFANMQVLKMDISNSSLERVFTYRTRSDTPAEGASARLGRIIGAVVSGGERLSFQPPSSQPNTSYALQVYVPLMQCNPANATLEDLIVKIVSETSGADSPAVGFPGNSPLDKETFHWRHNWADGKLQAEGDIGYFAVVPYYESNNLTFWWNSTQSRTISTDRFLGQIWIAIAEYPNNQTRMQFHGIMTAFGSPRFLLASETMNTNLTKSLQWYDMSQRIGTLAGSDGQVVGPENVQNSSLAEEIEEFALNSSLSMMNDQTLSKWVAANVTTTFSETIYVYEATNLFLAYGLAILFTIVSVIFGSYAFYLNGVSHDATVSTFAATMQNPGIKEILQRQPTGAQPIDRSIGKLKLRFSSGGGFVPKGSD